jgi:hypothetical protein
VGHVLFSLYDIKYYFNFQGFHILVDGTDGFAGLGTSAVEYLEEEYSTKSKLVFPVIPSDFINTTPLWDSVRVLNLALSFSSLADHSSLFVPLCMGSSGWRQPGIPRQFPHMLYNVSNYSSFSVGEGMYFCMRSKILI